MVKVSVIIPVYNVEKYLEKCVESIKNQTYKNLEIILVDDGSTDKSGEYCDLLEETDIRIKVIHKKNGGLSSARNAGLDIATGKYIYFLDSDDYVDDELIETCVQGMEEGNDMVIFNYRKVDDDETIMGYSSFKHQKWILETEQEKKEFIFRELFQYRVGWEAWSRIYSREIIENNKLRFADNNIIFAEDLYFFLAYIGCIKRIYSCGKVLYNYLIREGSIMQKNKDYVYNMSRTNMLSVELKKTYQKIGNCQSLLDAYSLIHIKLLYPYIIRLQNDNWTLKEIRKFLMHQMDNREFCQKEIINFLKEFKQYKYNNLIDDTLELKEYKNILQYFIDGNYVKLQISNRLLYLIEKQKIKYKKNYNNSIPERKKDIHRVYVVGTEDFGNVGDHFIAQTIIDFLEKLFNQKKEICEISARNFEKNWEELKKSIQEEDIIVLTGGGNMGNVYPFSERIRQRIIKQFPDNKIVIFPQTIYYDAKKTEFSKDDLIFYDQPNITISARDKKSFKMIENFKKANILFVPDIVLWNNSYSDEKKRNNVLVCLREDKEGVLDKEKRQCVVRYLRNKCKTIVYDTQLPYSVDVSERKLLLKECVQYFQSSRLVVTDRLHGMIICAITGTPCIVLDNYNQKVSGSYEWLKKLPYIHYLESIDKIEKEIDDLLSDEQSYQYEVIEKNRYKKLEMAFQKESTE